MSQFLGQNPIKSVMEPDDQRLWPRYHLWAGTGCGRSNFAPWEDAALWPNARFMGMCDGVPMGQDAGQTGRWQAELGFDDSGGQQQKRITGITRDSTGVALGSCVVQGFVTATEVYVGKVTSDGSGYFELPTPFPSTAHYLVAYRAGSPDIAGTTVNTLIPV